MENQTQLLQLAEELGLTPAFCDRIASRTQWICDAVNGVRFELEQQKNGRFRLIAAYNDPQLAEALKESFPAHDEGTKGLRLTCSTFDELAYAAHEVSQYIIDNDLGRTVRTATPTGVTFADTNFAGYGERDFMAAAIQIQKSGYATIIPGVGTNLGFEFQVPSTGSRIDAVEFDAAGNVVTVIECQSGVQSGTCLDDEHFAKAISRYPQSAEIRETVKKIIVIAGGFSEAQLATFGQLPYEIVALKTTVVDGKIALEVVA
jgi:hypothetical protein